MQIEKKKIAELERATYNPRITLAKGDREYEKIEQSIDSYGLVIPIVWNRQTNRVVGGHQRLTILEDKGVEEVEVSVVDIDEVQEKRLNIALNEAEGEWDNELLTMLLRELGDEATFTGFSQEEINRLTADIESLVETDILERELSNVENLYNVTLTFDKVDEAELKEHVRDFGKDGLVEIIVKTAKGEA